MAFDRTTILAGGAKIGWNSFTYITQSPIVLKMSKKMFEVMTDAIGLTAVRLDERDMEISFTPDGRWRADEKALFAGASSVAGDRWFGATDLPMTITPLSGKPFTLRNVNIFRPPQLIFGATKTMMGPVTFKALNQNNVEWSAGTGATSGGSLVLVGATGTTSALTGYAQVDILTQGITGTWGSRTGFVAFNTIDGIIVDFDLNLEPFMVDSYATVNYLFQKLDCKLRFKPVGPTEENVINALGIQGTTAIARGSSEDALGDDFIVKTLAGSTLFTANNATAEDCEEQWGRNLNRHGEIILRTTPEIAADALRPVFSIA